MQGKQDSFEQHDTEALAQVQAREAALREILGVISLNRDNEKPVFDTILKNACHLCDAHCAFMALVDDAGQTLTSPAQYGASPAFAAAFDTWKAPLATSPLGAAVSIRERRVFRVDDVADTDLYRSGDKNRSDMVDIEGIHSILVVPLLTPETGLGSIIIYRKEIRPFSDDHVALAETFAAQAVIAIENVRQYREVQSRLEREKASAEILDLISRTRDDEGPVFDVVLRRAATLCGAPMASLNIVEEDGKHGRLVAHWGDDLRLIEVGKTLWALDPEDDADLYTEISMRDGVVMHCPDLKDTDRYRAGNPKRCQLVDVEGIRTFLAVPLLRRGQAIGNIALYRRDVQPFTNDLIALVETFAAQAVIAIENVRQFREVQKRLEREAAVRNILRVISESPENEQPTFEAILDNATQLCGTPYASLVLGRKGDTAQRMVAHRQSTPEAQALYREGKVPMDAEDSLLAQAVLEGRTIHVPDMAETDQYRAGHDRFRMLVDHQGIRTNLFVPLLTPAGGIGSFILWKKEAAPFTDDQIALMETFASHAVIAIENVRQFRALQDKTEEVQALNTSLEARVDEQVGEIERMGKLKRFLPSAVADAVVSSGSDSMLSSHRALLGVLFCDIRGFTAFCETAEPEETIEVLQTYHEEMGKLINAHGAGVDHRIGDGIMVLFNDPLPCDDPAGDSVRLAIAMRERMRDLCARWKRLGHRLGFGVGISLGYATVGMVGSEGRFDYTASGTAINLASRLCDEAEDGEILLSPRASIAVEDDFAVEARGVVSFKGIREPLDVYRLRGDR